MEETVELLWSKVEEAWDEDKRHQAFLVFCQQNQLLGEAARRYRAIAEAPTTTATARSERDDAAQDDDGAAGAGPGADAESTDDEAAVAALEKRRAEAKKRLGAIALLAMSSLDLQRSSPPKQPRWLRILAIIIFLGSMGMLGWALTKLGASR